MLHRFVPCVFLLAIAAAGQARTMDAVVTHVSDGDTLWVRPAGQGAALQVRIQGIDAPELCQPFGRRARDALAGHALHRRVLVTLRGRDAYERAVGRVSLRGQDIGGWLVSGGYAWAGGAQRRAGGYSQAELAARGARRGLWSAPAPLAPWTFRKRHGACR